jgi:ribonuclease HI
MKEVTIYTDGACSGNPGAGGWAAVLMFCGRKKEISGFEEMTTNNRMELSAAVNALALLKEPCIVDIYSDSAYCINAFKEGWLIKWQLNGWKNAGKDEVKNRDLWEKLLDFTGIHKIKWNKVKGHSDNEFNNRCDTLAVKEITKHKVVATPL